MPALKAESAWTDSETASIDLGEMSSSALPKTGASPLAPKRSFQSLASTNLAPTDLAHAHTPSTASYAQLVPSSTANPELRTNSGNTRVVMALLSELWIFNLLVVFAGTWFKTFWLGQYLGVQDYELWNPGCWWKIGLLFPLPYTIVCFFGICLPFRTPKFLNYEAEGIKKRRLDNLYILTVTKGDNREAVYRAWEAHRHLERMHPAIRVHVLTDEPYFFEGINCYTCPKAFGTAHSKYKARALEWYRQTMRFTEHDWVLHLDEESVIDDESVRRVVEFIEYEKEFHFGQGVIFYNQYKYWNNWFFTVADALRVGDDVSRFALQYTYFHRPVFGAHGSFLLTNGLVENAVTWDLGSLTEDYQFAMKAWDHGFRCGKICGIVREQSPLDLVGFMKQRRRWYVGVRRLPNFLPKIWTFFWTLGLVSLVCFVLSVPLGFKFHYDTPRWMAVAADFNFVIFLYMYMLGIFLQDLDKKVNPFLMVLRVLITMPLTVIASFLEGGSVAYGILQPPSDFDVIKK